MKTEDLMDALNELPDEMFLETEQFAKKNRKPKKPVPLRKLEAAAAAVLVLGICIFAGFTIHNRSGSGTGVGSPTQAEQKITPDGSTGQNENQAGETERETDHAGASSVTGVDDLTEEEKSLDYGKAVMQNPDAVLPAADWIREDGTVWYPFDITNPGVSGNEFTAKCYVAKSVLKTATTENLIQLLEAYGPVDSYAYSNPCYYYQQLAAKLNITTELMSRADLGETLLGLYRNATLTADSEWSDENAVAVLEMLLARDEVYEQLSEEGRAEVVTLAVTLSDVRQTLSNLQKKNSAFFTAVFGYQLDGADAWYQYIKENADKDVVNQMSEFWE